MEYFAELSNGDETAAPEKNVQLKVVGKTDYHTYSKDHVWGQYGSHAEFQQRIENGDIDVQVQKTVMKAWMGLMVNLSRAGLSGTVQGCPFSGERWGRITNIGLLPNEYHDGSKWVPMKKGYTPTNKEVSALGFVKSGGKFVLAGQSSAIWPDSFRDYDFDKPAYAKRRQDWKQDTDTRWSRKFIIRPNGCARGVVSGGCGYSLGLTLELKKVETWQDHTITLCPGDFRSNSGCFSLDEPRVAVAAHEIGHLVGLPDEYQDGGIEPTLNGDGAKNGLDPTTIMGDSLGVVKKRHYANFASVAGILVSKKAGSKHEFVPADI